MEEIGVKLSSCSKSLTHSGHDSAERFATPPNSDLEDEQIRKMLASPLYIREREENEGQARACHSKRESLTIQSSRNPQVSGKKDAECVQKREENAQRTQDCHSRRESLMTSSSRDLEVSGKSDAMFSCLSESSRNTLSERNRSNESGNRFESSVHSVLRFADPANVGRSLLEGNKDHLLSQARSELMKQEDLVESLNNGVSELQQQTYGQKLELQDAQHGYVESRREQVRLQEEIIYEGKGSPRYSDTGYTRDGRKKRAQELRVDEFSVQKMERKS